MAQPLGTLRALVREFPGELLGEKWIPRREECVASARRFVRDIACDWEASPDAIEIAELLTSELVTNALRHGGNPANPAIRIVVTRETMLLTVNVHDANPVMPHPRLAGETAMCGRGLAIVQSLAKSFGWAATPYGKRVWFDVIAW